MRPRLLRPVVDVAAAQPFESARIVADDHRIRALGDRDLPRLIFARVLRRAARRCGGVEVFEISRRL